jgi:sugar lactone lactonase YvrE
MHPLALLLSALLLAVPSPSQLPPRTTGDVLVSSSGNNRLLRLDFRGVEVAAATIAGVAHPRGIVVTGNGTVFLVSQNTDEVVVLDAALRLVRRFPTGAVRGPTGAALGPGGNLFVAGFNSSNVGEYRLDGSFVRAVSANDLVFANCVTFLPDGSFVAASAGNGRVVHFEASGTVRASYTGFGLSSPMGMAVYGSELFVAGGSSHNIVVFDLAGAALRELRHADINGPQGVAFTADGVLITSSFYSHKISWFERNGTHLRTVTPPSSNVPRSLAFLPSLELIAAGAPRPGVPFPLALSSPYEPSTIYATALAFSTSPGWPMLDGRIFPLTPDPLFYVSLSGGAVFRDFIGVLDAGGRGVPTLHLPNIPGLTGLTLHAAALTFDPVFATLFRQMSAPASWTIR